MKVNGAMLLHRTVFKGPVDFRYTEVENNFEAVDAQFNYPYKDVNFNHVRVGDTILLKRTHFLGSANFSNSEYSIFQLESVDWPAGAIVNIGGMKYGSAVSKKGDNPDAWQELIKLANLSPFDAQTYRTLESFFESQGHPERADEVYFAYKKQERTFAETGFWQRLWNRLFEGFVRYGRRPEWAFLWSLLPLALGTLVFRKRESMVETSKKDRPRSENDEPESSPRPYYPFLYSLDSFLGPVDLGIEKQWEPKPERKAALVYLVCHKLVGWIFITVALFAVTGLVK
jgi:hypothetical protein